jgi:predicted kinase
MKEPYCITFAGVPGSSKSIVAHYLSETFGLPIFSNDNLRFEVREDMLAEDINVPEVLREFDKRRAERRERLFAARQSFILDASVDRSWAEMRQRLEAVGYRWFVIDMELSEAFLTRLYTKTDRPKAVEQLPMYLEQHQTFMATHGDAVGLQITDELFPERCARAANAVAAFIGDKV